MIANDRQINSAPIAAVSGGVLGGVIEDEFVILKSPNCAADFQVELAADLQQRIAQRLRLHSAKGRARQQMVVRVNLQRGGTGCAAHLKSSRVEYECVEFFNRPPILHKPNRQPIEQLRVRWLRAELAEIIRGGYQSAPEMPAPHAVHHHAGREGIVAIGNPLRQFKPPAHFVADRFGVR